MLFVCRRNVFFCERGDADLRSLLQIVVVLFCFVFALVLL